MSSSVCSSHTRSRPLCQAKYPDCLFVVVSVTLTQSRSFSDINLHITLLLPPYKTLLHNVIYFIETPDNKFAPVTPFTRRDVRAHSWFCGENCPGKPPREVQCPGPCTQTPGPAWQTQAQDNGRQGHLCACRPRQLRLRDQCSGEVLRDQDQ